MSLIPLTERERADPSITGNRCGGSGRPCHPAMLLLIETHSGRGRGRAQCGRVHLADVVSIRFALRLFFLFALCSGGVALIGAIGCAGEPHAVSIIEPIDGDSKLAMTADADALFKKIGMASNDGRPEPLVAPVVVIGPYRSGKSFLLNQLLGVGCTHGFGVGHRRHTQTRGIWMWSEPVVIEPTPGTDDANSGAPIHVLMIDTEGFESSRKVAYDDRIFILSTMMASVLIYNLPEAVREADVEKLSFAAELAEEFYGKTAAAMSSPSSTTSTASTTNAMSAVRTAASDTHRGGFEPPKLLWLVQRDFLQGQSVQANVEDALRPLPNSEKSPDIEHSNRVREALKSMASSVTAVGLRQPHLNRTALCELDDAQLDAGYIRERAELRNKVMALASPRRGPRGLMKASDLLKLIRDTIDVLNTAKIPSAGNLVEVFNRDLLQECADAYARAIEATTLPIDADELEKKSTELLVEIRARFDRERYGSHSSSSKTATSSARALEERIEKAYDNVVVRNKLRSSEVCTAASDVCITKIETLQSMTLPSKQRLLSQFVECGGVFNTTCVGPAKMDMSQRLQKAWTKAEASFLTRYNRHLSSSLLVVSLVGALMSRFILRRGEIELLCWACLFFLEFYPRVLFSEDALYGTLAWTYIAMVWEILVFNPLVDIDRPWKPLVIWPSIGFVVLRIRMYYWKKRRMPSLPRHRPVPD